MFARIAERHMHKIRWILTLAWLAIIASLFFDPWTPSLTQPQHPWSPLRLTQDCIAVQGKCLVEQPYPLGTTIFWGAIVPSAIFILLVFGHEAWRRICPLSFLSQIPRALGWQRQFKHENAKTGKVRYELAKVKPDSWLGKNYAYLQFSWLFIGLCGRILFFNADRLALAIWLLFTITAAIAVGYWYGGKSWCNYFCPMAPVQRIYSEPSGLFSSQAHTSGQLITQSMCRTSLPDGREQSACVACQTSCIDIDSERAYWDRLNQPEESFLRYGYVGLVMGYFVYYYLYAGNWSYYFSGAWARQTDQLASLGSSGFYLAGQAINVPKILAVPLTLGLFTLLGYGLGRWAEHQMRAYGRRKEPRLSPELTKHRLFTLLTFGVFNFFFIFGGRPLLQFLPLWLQYLYDLVLVLLSTLWVYKTWHRSPDLYSRENLANRFRKQLEKLNLNVGALLEGRSLGDLNTHEVYILAKVLPGFTREKRHTAYKGVVREALEEGYANYSTSLGVLQQLRQELGITDDEHREVLEELGIEDPELLNPDRQRSLENQIRLSGYRKSLERLMLVQRKQMESGARNVDSLLSQNADEIRSLRRQYSITFHEEDWILSGMSPEVVNLRRAEFLVDQLPALITCYRALNQPRLHPSQAVLTVLRDSIHHKKELIIRKILETLDSLADESAVLPLAERLGQLSPSVLVELLESEPWRSRLHPRILQLLTPLQGQASTCALDASKTEILSALEPLLQDPNPLIQTTSLYLIAHLDLEKGKAIARHYIRPTTQSMAPGILLQETAQIVLSLTDETPNLNAFPKLEKVVYLFNSDFFHRMHNETLIALAEHAEMRSYGAGAVITEAGDTCRELLLLIEGDAKVNFHLPTGEIRVEQLHAGQTLDELDVLAHSDSKNTILADSPLTRILAVPVDVFDNFLDLDHDFARRVLEMESRQLQRLMFPHNRPIE